MSHKFIFNDQFILNIYQNDTITLTNEIIENFDNETIKSNLASILNWNTEQDNQITIATSSILKIKEIRIIIKELMRNLFKLNVETTQLNRIKFLVKIEPI